MAGTEGVPQTPGSGRPRRRAPARLELAGITKAYPNVVANVDVDLRVLPGEIHAVLGENGAGKSTLMKIIYGVVRADAGTISWNGSPVAIGNPAAARALGIGMVFQHFSLFETLTVAENIALAVSGSHGLEALSERIGAVSERYGLTLDPQRLVHSLSVGERQRVEIVRCLLQDPKLLIMDEPTSVLTPQAVERLFATLRMLADEGCSILYISHKLDEVRALCERATILRGGRVTGNADPRTTSTAELARMMIGRELPVVEHRPGREGGAEQLAVAGLWRDADDRFGTALQDIHLTVRAGEILGVAGIAGNGQQELLAALSGETPVAEAAVIRLGGRPVGRLGAAARRDLGLAFIPEERLGRGAVPEMSLAENALLTAHRRGMIRYGLIRRQRTDAFTERCVRDFNVMAAGAAAKAKSLSGGNLQKFIVARELLQSPHVVLAAQPTWGVDVGAAAAIRQALIGMRNAGAAVLVFSEELDELFEICDRIAVIAGGRLSPARALSATNVDEIGRWMSGLFPGSGAPDAEREVEAVSRGSP